MLKPNWKEHAEGKASWGAISFMLADLHARTLRLEGKHAEADEYEAMRDKREQEMLEEDTPRRGGLWRRLTGTNPHQ